MTKADDGFGSNQPADKPQERHPPIADASTQDAALRLLIPINAKEDSRWGIQYALRQHWKGLRPEVILLNIAEPITQWQVLRFRNQQETTRLQSERAQAFIDEATQALAARGIPCRGVFKQGELVFSILDTAEELDCREIVMPAPKKRITGLFFDDVVTRVMRQKHDVPVVVVDSDGCPV